MCRSSLQCIDVPPIGTLTSETQTVKRAQLVHVPAQVYCEWNMCIGTVNAYVLPFNGTVEAVVKL